LQDNGGATPTHALLPGSPAIDKGDDTSCPTTDQRGLPRPQGAACDIGAYEFGATADLSISKARQGFGSVAAGDRITYTLTITNAGPTTPITATVVDTWAPSGAVVAAKAPGCTIDLAGGIITCTRDNLGIESGVLPDPYLVLTTSASFSGTLANSAQVSAVGGIVDIDTSDPVMVTVIGEGPPPVAHTDLSISKLRQGSGEVLAGERITYTLTITNAGPATPITATVVDTWTPVGAVVGAAAPGCAIDLAGGAITCTRTNVVIGSVLLPDPYIVFTTSPAFSGTLTNSATVTTTGIVDDDPTNNSSTPINTTITWSDGYREYLPLILR
jgi:uncharacterized repeat protein (TIGR01451 family)